MTQVPCICTKCKTKALSIAGKQHRRCPGQENQPIREKEDKLPSANRGEWAPA